MVRPSPATATFHAPNGPTTCVGILSEETGRDFLLVPLLIRELADEPALILFVLETDVFDELVVCDEGGVELERKRLHVGSSDRRR
jgi:hypothetical protein